MKNRRFSGNQPRPEHGDPNLKTPTIIEHAPSLVDAEPEVEAEAEAEAEAEGARFLFRRAS